MSFKDFNLCVLEGRGKGNDYLNIFRTKLQTEQQQKNQKLKKYIFKDFTLCRDLDDLLLIVTIN